MKQRIPNPKKKKTSLSSKLKAFWILHPNVLIILICAIFIALAITILCIVGVCNHWNMRALFTSPKAILIYVVVGFVAIIYVFQRMIFKRW